VLNIYKQVIGIYSKRLEAEQALVLTSGIHWQSQPDLPGLAAFLAKQFGHDESNSELRA
jgi:hypothetical protein